ncbi:conserved membrane hypothetical protein [Candidatus Methylobacter favarea]|uniref:YetF C-terminal domain-containing protein n=1 Tax=Candidatus Methylobacter favarea TaxID=2707345 RepID=A0A8S0X9M5_9GAMM|nr:YetF domain-containing protein [Candidatus Methylobacter favarea]CAA9892456.1 conserved membrane hypothetical protein [Candidatus Methylobacter favarea]
MPDIDWEGMFMFSASPLEIIIRGTVVYWFLFLVFRFVVRRDVGSVGIADVLVLVIVADAAQNAMAGQYKSISEGCILVSTIVFWNFLLDWLSYRYPKLGRLAQSGILCLVKDGKMLRKNMRKEMVTEEELMSKVRQQGLEDLSQVRDVYMEGDGTISVIKREP